MIRGLTASLVLALAACGGGSEGADEERAAQPAGAAGSGWVSSPEIGVMTLPNVQSFCSFFPEGHDFDFDDPATWQFVFVTVFDDTDVSPDNLNGRILLSGVEREVELITAEASDTGEVRQYRTVDAPVAVIEVTMDAGEEGYEATAYTGQVAVTYPEGGDAVRFDGDCGV